VTTALDLISRSLRLLGVYAKGESPDPSETSDGLAVLNALMGALSTTPLVYAKSLDTIALSAGVSSITVGPSGTTITDRPMEVLAESYLTNGSVSYPLRIYTDQQYSDIPVKSTQAIPTAVWPLMSMPNVQLTFYPVPIGGLTLNLWSVKQLQTFPSLTTVVSLPPGYEAALPSFLAEELAPEYGLDDVPPAVQRMIRRHRRNLEAENLNAPMLKQPAEMGRYHFNILTNGTVV
jgi:hypothetical protein